MFFSKITGEQATLPVERAELLADPDGEHRLLWDFFPADSSADRDFLYRRLHTSSTPSFLVVSSQEPEDKVTGFSVEVKSYEPVINDGDEYRFNVRVNSTVKSNGAYHDVVMNRKHALKQKNVPRSEWPSEAELERETGLEWMKKRDEKNGFQLQEDFLKVIAHDKHKFEKRSGNHEVTITTMDMTGFLTVENSDIFRELLFEGLGRKAVYGCGLMMIQPKDSNLVS